MVWSGAAPCSCCSSSGLPPTRSDVVGNPPHRCADRLGALHAPAPDARGGRGRRNHPDHVAGSRARLRRRAPRPPRAARRRRRSRGSQSLLEQGSITSEEYERGKALALGLDVRVVVALGGSALLPRGPTRRPPTTSGRRAARVPGARAARPAARARGVSRQRPAGRSRAAHPAGALRRASARCADRDRPDDGRGRPRAIAPCRGGSSASRRSRPCWKATASSSAPAAAFRSPTRTRAGSPASRLPSTGTWRARSSRSTSARTFCSASPTSTRSTPTGHASGAADPPCDPDRPRGEDVRRRVDGAEGACGVLLRRADRGHGGHRVDRRRRRPAPA